MPTIPGVMRILQFGDSMLPVGAFSFSHGLESAVQLGIVRDAESLERFVAAALRQAATSDGVAVLAAFRAAQDDDLVRVVGADFAVHNRKLNEEMRTMTVRMGRKLAEMAERVLGPGPCSSWLAAIRGGEAPGCLPVGQALVFASLGLSETDAFAVHQYGLASMMVAASLRLMRLHYLDAQAILFRVHAQAEAHYELVASTSIDDMASFAPVMDIVASSHVKATVRMFMN